MTGGSNTAFLERSCRSIVLVGRQQRSLPRPCPNRLLLPATSLNEKSAPAPEVVTSMPRGTFVRCRAIARTGPLPGGPPLSVGLVPGHAPNRERHVRELTPTAQERGHADTPGRRAPREAVPYADGRARSCRGSRLCPCPSADRTSGRAAGTGAYGTTATVSDRDRALDMVTCLLSAVGTLFGTDETSSRGPARASGTHTGRRPRRQDSSPPSCHWTTTAPTSSSSSAPTPKGPHGRP